MRLRLPRRAPEIVSASSLSIGGKPNRAVARVPAARSGSELCPRSRPSAHPARRARGARSRQSQVVYQGGSMPTYLSPGVYVEEVDSGSRPIEGVGTAVAAFVGLAEDGPFNTPTLVPNWTEFVRNFGGFVEGSYLAQSVYAYFQNGGGNCYVVRDRAGLVGQRRQRGRGASPPARRACSAPTGWSPWTPAPPRARSTVDVHGVEGDAPDGPFKLVVRQGDQVLEEYDRLNTGRGKANVATAVNAASKLIKIEETATGAVDRGTQPRAPASACSPRRPPAAVPSPRLSADDYVGDVAERTGFSGLEAVDEVTMVCVPDLMSAYQQGAIDQETVKAVQLAMIAHCELMGDRDRDPRSAARTERPADQGMAGRQGRLRLEVRRAVLAVGQGRRPGHRARTSTCRRPASSPASGAATTTPAACTRLPRTRWSAARSRSRCRSPRTSTTC